MSYAARHGERGRKVAPVDDRGSPVRVIAIIPAHNELGQLGHTLTALVTQTRKPDEIYVLTDNAVEGLAAEAAEAAEAAGFDNISITCTVGNVHKKAGNLNRALLFLLDRQKRGLSSCDVIMGFDADSVPERHFVANALKWMARGYGAVGATFSGRPGGGILGALQRAEFARFARHQHRKSHCDVLSGTGWAISVKVLRLVAASRTDCTVYDVNHIVEDFELTLKIRHMGVKAISPADCRVVTDIMITLKDWVTQRLRWQYGTLLALYRYGWTQVTQGMIIRQLMTYLVMLLTPLVFFYLLWSFLLFGIGGIDPANAPLYAVGIGVVVLEQAWQARKAGPRAVIMTLLIVPDLAYSLARQVVYIRALYRLLARKTTAWGAGTTL